MNPDFINQLKVERTAQVRIRDRAADEVKRLDIAISALNGEPAPVTASGPSVVEMVLKCCQRFCEQHSPGKPGGLAITNRNIVETAGELFKEDVAKIKRGLANAVTSLKKKNKLKLCAGGLELLP